LARQAKERHGRDRWFGVGQFSHLVRAEPLSSPLAGMESLAARMLVALKCAAVATLFGLVAGIESVAH
jgi:hypothetical protein